jgi:hypothetical protein
VVCADLVLRTQWFECAGVLPSSGDFVFDDAGVAEAIAAGVGGWIFVISAV